MYHASVYYVHVSHHHVQSILYRVSCIVYHVSMYHVSTYHASMARGIVAVQVVEQWTTDPLTIVRILLSAGYFSFLNYFLA